MRLRLTRRPADRGRRDMTSTRVFDARRREADEFYATVIPPTLSRRCRERHAAGARRPALVEAVLPLRGQGLARGDPGQPPPPPERRAGRNHEWRQLYNADVISMPDKWEYPWYAAWDLAFHCVPLALVDSEFAKEQLMLMLREWYMHPNGQLPAYEWALGDVNPPVHAWAAWRVYKIEKKRRGKGDIALPRARVPQAAAEFHLVGQPQGRRGHEHLSRADSSASTTSACSIAARRCRPAATSSSRTARAGWRCTRSTCWRSPWSWREHDPAYEDVASKFWEHFLYIAHAMNNRGSDGLGAVGRRGRILLRRAAPARRRTPRR